MLFVRDRAKVIAQKSCSSDFCCLGDRLGNYRFLDGHQAQYDRESDCFSAFDVLREAFAVPQSSVFGSNDDFVFSLFRSFFFVCTLVRKRNLKSMFETMALHFSLPSAYGVSAIYGRVPWSCVCWLSFLFSRSLALQSADSLELAGVASTPWGFLSFKASRV